MALGVEQVITEGLRHAGTTVIRGAAPDTHDEVTRTTVVRMLEQLADPVGGRDPWIPFVLRQQRQTGGLRHLDHGGFASVDHAVVGIDGIRERTAHPQYPMLAVGAGDQGIDRPIATVGNRHQRQVGIRVGEANAVADRLRSRKRR